MLVCNVSRRPPRTGIAADLAEAATAADSPGIGNVVFATLVDDPAAVRDTVDAFLGQVMREAATAADVCSVVVVPKVGSITETVTAADAPNATVTSASTVTWEAATVAAVTLSSGNLVATNTGTTATNQGAHVASTSGKATGKYYVEMTWTLLPAPGVGGGNMGVGIGTAASTYTTMGNGGTTGVLHYRGGSTWSNAAQILTGSGGWTQGQIVGMAIDLDNKRFWFRAAPTGNWNNSGTANPATNTGGLTIPAGTMVPFLTFGGSSGIANNIVTANFGSSAFSGTVPSGFTSGWPV